MEEIITTVGKIAITAFAIFALVAIISTLTTGDTAAVPKYINELISQIFTKAQSFIQTQ